MSPCSSDYIFPPRLWRAWRIVSEGSIMTSLLINRTCHIVTISLVVQDSRSFQHIAKFIDSNGHLTVSRRSKPSSRTVLTGEQPDPWDLVQPQDTMSRHRGANPRCRYELSSAISLLSPEYLLFVERRQSHDLPPDHLALLSYLLDMSVSQLSSHMPMHSKDDCQPS